MWHKCIHMRAESHGEESLPWPAGGSALWECKTRQMDSSHLCGLPLVTHWEMFPYCIEEHQLLHWSREGSPGYSIYLIPVFFFLPSCLSFAKNAAEITQGSAEKHGSTTAWGGSVEYEQTKTIQWCLKYCQSINKRLLSVLIQ